MIFKFKRQELIMEEHFLANNFNKSDNRKALFSVKYLGTQKMLKFESYKFNDDP